MEKEKQLVGLIVFVFVNIIPSLKLIVMMQEHCLSLKYCKKKVIIIIIIVNKQDKKINHADIKE